MQLDKNGDSEGNFSVLALTNVLANNNNINNNNSAIVINNFTCKYQMRQVGQFQQGEFPVSEFAQISMFVIIISYFILITSLYLILSLSLSTYNFFFVFVHVQLITGFLRNK